jgi:hypothetical protein
VGSSARTLDGEIISRFTVFPPSSTRIGTLLETVKSEYTIGSRSSFTEDPHMPLSGCVSIAVAMETGSDSVWTEAGHLLPKVCSTPGNLAVNGLGFTATAVSW